MLCGPVVIVNESFEGCFYHTVLSACFSSFLSVQGFNNTCVFRMLRTGLPKAFTFASCNLSSNLFSSQRMPIFIIVRF